MGWGTIDGPGGNDHALLWTGTAASAVDLNPTNLGIVSSVAFATDGTQQVGDGAAYGASFHALLWNGTAASAVDLNPAGFTDSTAVGTNGTQQVGTGQISSTDLSGHALLWTGTAASAVDLSPTDLPGITSSTAYGTNGTQQVGVGIGSGTSNRTHALLWSGTAASAVDLDAVLPLTGEWSTNAFSIDSSGDVYGEGIGTFNGVSGDFAIEWFPTVGWDVAVNGSWTNAANWSSQTVPSSTTGAYFNTGSATPYTVTLAGSSAPDSITVQDNVTIQKAGFNLAVPHAVTISGTSGQHSSLTLAGSGLSTFGSLSINSFGQLDITDNTVIINYGVGNPTPVRSIGAYIVGGYNGSAWNGAGIVSSKVASVNAAKENSHLFAVGYADASDITVAADHFTPGIVVIEPAIVGDANLDGVVNFTDFQLLAANFNGSNTSWDQGNFDYSGKTDFTDFQLLAANFNDSTSLDNAELNSMNQFAKSFGDTLVPNADGVGFTIVPEPATVTLLGLSAAGLLMRRRGISLCLSHRNDTFRV